MFGELLDELLAAGAGRALDRIVAGGEPLVVGQDPAFTVEPRLAGRGGSRSAFPGGRRRRWSPAGWSRRLRRGGSRFRRSDSRFRRSSAG
jgi:hypothetical protein